MTRFFEGGEGAEDRGARDAGEESVEESGLGARGEEDGEERGRDGARA